MEQKVYKKIRYVAGPACLVTTAGVHPPANVGAQVSGISHPLLDQMLAHGWVIIQIVTHTSLVHDATGIVYIMGLPKEAPDEPDEQSGN